MKKILLVEDVNVKADLIIQYIRMNFPDIEIDRRESYNSAIKTIFNEYDKYNLILLDMSMSTFDVSVEESGGVPEPIAGKRILDGMFLRDIPIKVVVVTMYENFDGIKLNELNNNLKNCYPDNYYNYVFFSFQKNDWQEKLKQLIKEIIYGKDINN